MRLSDYYSSVVRSARSGQPTMREAREDYRRNLQSNLDACRMR